MTGPAPREGARRRLHVATAALGPAAALLPRAATTALLVALVLAAVLAETARRRSPWFAGVVERVAGSMFRPAERRRISGATLLVTAYLATWLLFPSWAAARAVTVAALADPAAAFVGTRWSGGGRTGRKTWLGSAGAFLAALAVLLAWRTAPPAALAGALCAALAERAPGPGSDNVAVPLATAAALMVAA